MSSSSMAEATKRCAVVTGANKGIGFEICRQLASNDIVVVLTARNMNNGREAVKKLKNSGIPDHLLVFHRLDVTDPDSIASLADFVKTQFGKLDILVNNAGVSGVVFNHDSFRRTLELHGGLPEKRVHWDEFLTQNLEEADPCLKTNYYGAKAMVEAFIPFLQLSDSPRIVNVSSFAGLLKYIPNEWAKGSLSDVEGLTEEKIDEVVNEFMKDFKDGLLKTK